MRHRFRLNESREPSTETDKAGKTQVLNKDVTMSTRILIWVRFVKTGKNNEEKSLIVSFVICWTPFHLYHIAVSLGKI